MRDQAQRMIDRQGEIISNQRTEITNLRVRIDMLERELDKLRQPAGFYMALQKKILAEPMLMAEWERFLMALRLHGIERIDSRPERD